MNNLSFGKGIIVPKGAPFPIIFRIMKIATALMLVFMTCAYGSGKAQKVSLSLLNAKLEDAFKEITKQTNFKFLYNDAIIKDAKRINLKIDDAGLNEAMSKLLANNNMAFKIIDKTITISPIEDKNLKPVVVSGYAQQNQVKGTVHNTEGQPLAGASVSVKGGNGAVSTNAQGEFTINAPANSTLVIRFIGYDGTEVAIEGRKLVNIRLKAQDNTLEAVNVVATGYQNIDRKFFTGASSKVNAKDAERSGVPDVSRMLEGQVAGVSVQNVSGTFGAAPKVRVRGATSLSGDNKPLWVIDGIIMEDMVNISNEALSTGDANTLLGSSVAGLNPDDIESFNILKDAAATAMYGARAMNGVIVVTTKKGRNTDGKANINYSGTMTTYLKPNYNQFDIMNSAEQMSVLMELENKGYYSHSSMANVRHGGIFAKMYDQMYMYDPASDSFKLKNTKEEQLNFLSRYAKSNTDWFDVLFKNSLLQEHSLSVMTGTDRAQNYFSTSMTHDNGQTIADKVKRFTGNIRSNIKISDKLSAELLAATSIRDQNAPGTLTRDSDPVFGTYTRNFDINPYSYALNTSRLITPYNEDGSLEYFTRNYAPFNIINELNTNYLSLRMLDLKLQGGLKYKILSNLTYSLDGAYRYANSTRKHYILDKSNMAEAFRANGNAIVNANNIFLYEDPDYPNNPKVVILNEGGFFNPSSNEIKNYYFRQNLEYDLAITELHRFNLFGSMEMRYTDRDNYEFDGVGYQYNSSGLVNPNYLYFKKMIEAADPYFGMGYGKERNVAFMFRGAYNFNDKYSFNGTVRYDGSNRMGAVTSARWLPTWNVSGAWNVDQESFYPKNDVLSSVRVRGTYGLVANMGNANNTSTLYYNRITYRPKPEDKETQVYISSLANSELTWEKLYEFNVGGDLGWFNDKVNVTVDFYKRNIFDLLGLRPVSGVGGQSQKLANYGKIKASGFEFTIAGNPIQKDNGFKWRTQFNFGLNKNEVTELDVNPNIWTLVRAEGAPMKGYSQRGLFSVTFDGLDPNYGYPTYIGTDGKRNEPYIYLQNTTDVANLTYHGPVDPTFTGGFYNQVSHKGITLSALLTFATGNYVRLQPIYSASYSDFSSISKDFINRWVMPGDEKYTNIPSLLDAFDRANNIVRPNGNTTNSQYPYNVYSYSDQRVAKGDFIRLKNVSLAYQLPKEWVSKLRFSTAQLALVGNNIALLYSDKKLNGADPEFFNNGGVAMPIPKQYTLSVKLGF
ncbi:SusC/RagA family TonB-linked outer membrane protein [Sphingobacterium faecale]|uniref:SusC/RagA family TonB-linked outer membrane protein n=1 Tax=Sphingobacterium faecale TaxID=2803775 RepID=A0ABS1R7P7_9SPHI|nr:SusC/RagA family TonB-linked outer membrane protein [Sphingobacterium faecale]MBL1410712.1 SusC/RagA family TonB-linked outer membrane protein [Sphingobacterium faecale]